MVENKNRPEIKRLGQIPKEQSRQIGRVLKGIVRTYFSDQAIERQRSQDLVGLETLARGQCQKIVRLLNGALRTGSQVAVLNFPTVEGQFCQVHLLANQKYLRSSKFDPQRLPVEVEEQDQGFTWVEISFQKPEQQARPDIFTLDIHTELSHRTIEISPQNAGAEPKSGGLAILWRKGQDWQLILEIDWKKNLPFRVSPMI